MNERGVLMIVSRPETAQKMQRLFSPREVKVMTPGAPVIGQRFSAILITEEAYAMIHEDEVLYDWLQHQRLRLPPGTAETGVIKIW